MQLERVNREDGPARLPILKQPLQSLSSKREMHGLKMHLPALFLIGCRDVKQLP